MTSPAPIWVYDWPARLLATTTPPSDWPAWLGKFFDAHEPFEVWWLALGIFAQALFFSRWVVQLVATERRGTSHVPEGFWWVSLAGAVLLTLYFAGRSEPVGFLGSLGGLLIYARNVQLIMRQRRRARAAATRGSE